MARTRAVYEAFANWSGSVDDQGRPRFEDRWDRLSERDIFIEGDFTYGSVQTGSTFDDIDPGKGFVTLHNPDGLFNRDNAASPLADRTEEGILRNRAYEQHEFQLIRTDGGRRRVVFQCHIYPPFEELDASEDFVTFELAHDLLRLLRERKRFSSSTATTLGAELIKLGLPHRIIGEDRALPPFAFGEKEQPSSWITQREFLRRLARATAMDPGVDRLGVVTFRALDVPRTYLNLRAVNFSRIGYDSRVDDPITDVTFTGREFLGTSNWLEASRNEDRGPLANLNRWGVGFDTGFFGSSIASRVIDPAERNQAP